jgi:mannose-6-phosphate isomerase
MTRGVASGANASYPRSVLRTLLLDNPIQGYAWGSLTAIAELLGRPSPAAAPEAEMWIGAHPRAPSRVVDPPGLGTLDRLIESDPTALLGPSVCERFGSELPFLLKVLAAREPLSIQAHPDQHQAREGWKRENAEGIPIDDPRRSYRDPHHKPELVSALTPFVALKGFRPTDEIAERLRPVAGPELAEELDRVATRSAPAALRSLVARLMTLDPDERGPVLRRARIEALRRGGDDPSWDWVGRLLRQYPDDAGALGPLYLNLVTLAPGDALFLPARELHAYLEGTAIEIMANSDNVLRGGLTPKHVDVPELLATLAFEPRPPDVLRPAEAAPGELAYRTPAREFELSFLLTTRERPHRSPAGRGVEILLCLDGRALLETVGAPLELRRGGSAFVPASVTAYVLTGEARVARASVPAAIP